MSGSTGTEQPTITSSQAPPTGKKGREKSRDVITALEERLAHLEGIVSEQRDRSDDLDMRLTELESKGDEVELRAEMQGALNIAVDVLSKKDQAMEAILLAYREKVDKLEEELALCKTALVSGVGTSGRYFEAVGITEDAVKLRTVPLYLGDVATVWWRRRCEDIKKGTCTISTWGEFTKELKRQFYPENAESEARAKLRRLQHKEGAIREYVKEFSELMLEIPDMGEKDALFCFLDGLSNWAKMELQRRGVQDLATAMAAAESLIEFKRKEPSKDKGKSQTEATKPEVETSPSRARTPWNKGARDKAKEKEEETEPSEERHVASLQLLSAIKAKVKGQNQGRMLVEAGVHGTPVVALVDTGADTIYMSTQLADEIRLPYEKVQGSVKGVTAESMPISGVARIHHVHHATWTALLCANKRENGKGNVISAMQLSKGLKRNEPTFLAAFKEDEGQQDHEDPERAISSRAPAGVRIQYSKEVEEIVSTE
ncbi:hypothetical protein GH714_044001 [Hevea brasiliensis]|uniref:Retrotransposon gag domain-containing protein n=1 Tax=Hevea brasiliensis TaxID=3981 RepID=A0A6A6K1J5_HEVBR|nr:hypothetical protein GH714_044001 [Hevea brasiliensis]